MKPIESRILDLVASKTSRPPSLADSLDSLGIDSLAMAELIYEIESDFEIQSDDDLLELSTIRELCNYVSERIAAHPSE